MKKYLIILILFSGCQTAEKLTHRAIAKDAAKVQQITRQLWPCIITDQDSVLVRDTVYDIVEVQCPDSIGYRIDTLERNTAVRVPYRVPVYVKVKQPRIRETTTVTIRIRDMVDTGYMNKQVTVQKAYKKVFMWLALAGWLLAIILILIRRK